MTRPVARKKLTWVSYWEQSPVELIMLANGNAAHSDRVLITEAEVTDFDSECTVLRIIGEFGWFVQNPATAVNVPYNVLAGVIVRESEDTNVINMSVTDKIQEYPWAWLQTYMGVPDGVSVQGQAGVVDAVRTQGGLDKVDIRVKRKLREGEQLLWTMTGELVAYAAQALPANGDLNLHSFLRVRILVEA